MTDDETFFAFCQAGAAFLERGLHFARRDDPQAYADVLELINTGRARPQLVVDFHPKLQVNLRLVANADGHTIADVFTYTATSAKPVVWN